MTRPLTQRQHFQQFTAIAENGEAVNVVQNACSGDLRPQRLPQRQHFSQFTAVAERRGDLQQILLGDGAWSGKDTGRDAGVEELTAGAAAVGAELDEPVGGLD